MTPETEKELIERCRRQDMRAYKSLFETYRQPLFRTAARMLGNRQDAEDAVQNTFLKLYRGIGNFRFQSKFSSYLFRIMLNTCFDHLKKKNPAEPHNGPEPANLENSLPDVPARPVLKYRLEQAIDTLPRQMRACFVLFAVEEFKQKEIAGILGLSTGTVKAHIFNAKSRLRDQLLAAGALEKETP